MPVDNYPDIVELEITYEGPAVEDGKIDIEELSSILAAVEDLFTEANRQLFGREVSVTVKLSTYTKGSANLGLEIILKPVGDFLSFLGSDPIAGALVLKESISWLIKAIKKSKGKELKSISINEDGSVKLSFEDDEISIPNTAFDLYKSLRVKQKLKELVIPLEKEGFERFIYSRKTPTEQIVTKSDLKAFQQAAEEDSSVQETECEITLTISSLHFKKGNKWRLSDGQRSYWARITDVSFLNQIDSGRLAFSKNDLLHVRLITRQWLEDGKLKSDYEIQRVISHRKVSDNQLGLPF
jgi:hypothetical protein